jgi:hypothetical protein
LKINVDHIEATRCLVDVRKPMSVDHDETSRANFNQLLHLAAANLKFKSSARNNSSSKVCWDVMENMPTVFITLANDWTNFQAYIEKNFRCRTVTPFGGCVQSAEPSVYQIQFLVWLCKDMLHNKRPSSRHLCAISMSLQIQRHCGEHTNDSLQTILALAGKEPNAFIKNYCKISTDLLYLHALV